MSKPTDLVKCPDCDGTGIDSIDATMQCPLCDGEKKLPRKDVPEIFRDRIDQ